MTLQRNTHDHIDNIFLRYKTVWRLLPQYLRQIQHIVLIYISQDFLNYFYFTIVQYFAVG